METSNGWDNLSADERARLISQKEQEARNSRPSGKTSLSIFKDEAGKGMGNIARGLVYGFKGVDETVVGLVREVDAAALGLGVIAITAAGMLLSPVPAILSREKNIVDINRQVITLAQTPSFARLVGYPLLAVAGGFGINQAVKALN